MCRAQPAIREQCRCVVWQASALCVVSWFRGFVVRFLCAQAGHAAVVLPALAYLTSVVASARGSVRCPLLRPCIEPEMFA